MNKIPTHLNRAYLVSCDGSLRQRLNIADPMGVWDLLIFCLMLLHSIKFSLELMLPVFTSLVFTTSSFREYPLASIEEDN